MAHRLVRGVRGAVRNLVFHQQTKPINRFLQSSTQDYASEMRKSAFEGNILRLIRSEIQYELDHSPTSKVLQTLFFHLHALFFSSESLANKCCLSVLLSLFFAMLGCLGVVEYWLHELGTYRSEVICGKNWGHFKVLRLLI